MRQKILLAGLMHLVSICLSITAADFSIMLAGTPKYFLMKDVNKGISGYLDFWADLLRLDGGTVADNKKSMHIGMDYSINIIFALNANYSVRLGAGYLQAKNKSEVVISYADGRPETNAVVETRLEAIPIRLSVIRNYHLAKSLTAFMEGGLEVYNARFRSSSWPAGPGDTHIQDARSIGIGVLYGGGLEIRAFSHVALVLEALGNYSRIGGFKGARESVGSTIPHEEKGALYLDELIVYSPPGNEKIYPLLMIYEEKPSGDRVRPARLDFSGFSLSVGVKIFF